MLGLSRSLVLSSVLCRGEPLAELWAGLSERVVLGVAVPAVDLLDFEAVNLAFFCGFAGGFAEDFDMVVGLRV